MCVSWHRDNTHHKNFVTGWNTKLHLPCNIFLVDITQFDCTLHPKEDNIAINNHVIVEYNM